MLPLGITSLAQIKYTHIKVFCEIGGGGQVTSFRLYRGTKTAEEVVVCYPCPVEDDNVTITYPDKREVKIHIKGSNGGTRIDYFVNERHVQDTTLASLLSDVCGLHFDLHARKLKIPSAKIALTTRFKSVAELVQHKF
jgi:hypothetical protein